MLTVTALFAGVLALVYVALSVHVIRGRYTNRLALGDGGNASMNRRIRAHANFAEYVPMALILMAVNELGGVSANTLVCFGVLLLAGRISHAYSILVAEARASGSHIKFRQAGMAATFTVIVILALMAIF